jgi:predicted patatin/cPLA2 family phospholipase
LGEMPKRSLMLAGGGVKIPFQAGVMQVWMDEAGIVFDHADAVSAAAFNLAMWAQGMSGTEIVQNWLKANPLSEVDVDLRDVAKLLYARSLFTLDHFRTKVFPAWGIDFEKIRAAGREATFNVYNFSKHQLVSVEARELTEDHLIAAGSLPVWFPPVVIEGDTYIDAVFNLASNLEEAIRRGSDELWVIWTISERGEWFDGFVGNFFGIFEATTVHAYKAIRERIDRNNTALSAGQPGEFGRVITVRELKAEVPIHYLFNFNQDRVAEAVNRGIEAARAWCDAEGIARKPGREIEARSGATSVRFEEHLASDAGDVKLRIVATIADLDAFLADPSHTASAIGELGDARLMGQLQVLVDAGDPSVKTVRFTLSGDGVRLTGVRRLAPGVPHRDVELSIEGGWHGVVRTGPFESLREVLGLHVDAPSVAEHAKALARFGAFYFGHLWDVYARRSLPYGPV